MPKKKKQIAIVIDANALLHRSFHALPPTLRTKDGQLTNAVYGFTTVLFKVLKELKPTHIAVAFDKEKKTFRHEQYTEYKAGRAKTPDEFYEQLPLVKDVLAALNIPVYEKSGYEADDIIGTIARKNEEKNIGTVIVTGDKDAFQLLSPQTKVYTLRKGIADTVLYDTKAFSEKYGIAPEQLIDFKAIAGDSSDNIPGVKGIGEKGATSLLQKFGTLEKIYDAIDKKGDDADIPKRQLTLLKKHKKEAFLSKQLATIVTDVPCDYAIDDAALQPYDRQEVFALFQQLEFRSLLQRLPDVSEQLSADETDVADNQTATHKKDGAYTLIDTDVAFADFFAALEKQKIVALDTESTNIDPIRADLLGISFSWKSGKGYYCDIKKNPAWLQKLKPFLEDDTKKKVGHNIKYDMIILQNEGISLQGIAFDSMVGSYLLNAGSRGHGLDNLAFEIFGHEMQPISDLIGKGKSQISMAAVPVDKVSWYACEDADFTWQLYEHFRSELEDASMLDLLEKLELPLIPVLAHMERTGVKIDTGFLGTLSEETGRTLQQLQKKIYTLAGGEFNINSPIQLQEVLFETLDIPTDGISKTKTGISTAAAELEKLQDTHEIIPLLQQYRELSKLRSTYLEALPELVNPDTGRVHTSFNQTITATGRLSSSDPNLQNIPIRRDEGRKIRKAFIAEKGKKILAADYSQIELRIIASIAGDERMIESFKNGEDIHSRTAADVNQISLEQVTKKQRYEAKEVNFGILYGMGAWGLASRQGMSRERARAFIEKYFAVHPQIQEYIAETIATARDQGYVETLFGRRRYLPDINSSMPRARAGAERMAINMPIQGTAADMLKVAMIDIYEKLSDVSADTRMVLQVHDELVFEVPTADIDRVAEFVRKTMNEAYDLAVPVETEIEVGPNWGTLTPIETK